MIYKVEFESKIEIKSCCACKLISLSGGIPIKSKCGMMNKEIDHINIYMSKPNWCPLKEVQNG